MHKKVSTLEDLKTLDPHLIYAGYMWGLRHKEQPEEDSSRDFWHGWFTAQLETRRVPMDTETNQLIIEINAAEKKEIYNILGRRIPL